MRGGILNGCFVASAVSPFFYAGFCMFARKEPFLTVIHAAYLYKDTLWPLHATLQHTHTQLRTHRGSTCRLVQKATFWSPAPLYAPRLFWLLLSSAGFAVLCSPRPLNSARSAALCATQGTWPAVVELCRRWREPSSALLVASLCRG